MSPVKSAASVQPSYVTPQAIHTFIESALAEDLGDGDHTTLATVSESQTSKMKLLVKDTGIVAGVELARKIFEYVDASVTVDVLIHDGSAIKPGDIVMVVEGLARSLLKSERLVLNCIQRMSGIATQTDHLCRMLDGTKTRLLDTRKTTPNFRMAEKWAVWIGGGVNHRFGLFDRIMIKDNHIDLAGGVKPAIEQVKKYFARTGKKLEIEVETRSLEEVDAALAAGGVDIILLDNMTPAQLRTAVDRINGACRVEASGGITEHNVREVAQTGVDFISIGALTHTVRSLDLSLKVVQAV